MEGIKIHREFISRLIHNKITYLMKFLSITEQFSNI